MSPLEKVVATVADRTGLTRTQADKVVRETFVVLSEFMQDGDRVQVPSFGIFETVDAAPRITRSPKTGLPVNVPQRRRPKFRPSSVLQKSVNK